MEKLWNLLKNIVWFILTKVLNIKITDRNWDELCQFLKFGMVGLSNTLISYVVYMLLIAINVHYLAASLVGFLVSVINAYYWNDKYVFKVNNNEKRIWWHAFLKTFMSYAGTGLILNNILLIFWVDVLKLNKALGPLINLLITIPLNFLLNKYWAFKNKK